MIAVPVSPWTIAWFELRKIVFLFVVPFLIGFAVAVLYPLGQRVAAQHRRFLMVVLFASLGPAAMLFGWSLVIRTRWTALPYGAGYGLGAACLSRIHTLRLWPFRIVTRTPRPSRHQKILGAFAAKQQNPGSML